jgi:hypothetical protein
MSKESQEKAGWDTFTFRMRHAEQDVTGRGLESLSLSLPLLASDAVGRFKPELLGSIAVTVVLGAGNKLVCVLLIAVV